MKKSYACPHCKSVLNPSVKVLLAVRYNRKQGMILLSPQPGNFKYICDPTIAAVMKPGASVNFHCPVCSVDLVSPSNKKFVELDLVNPGGRNLKVEFSRILGTHATFIIDGEEITGYGEDQEDKGPTNFFGS